MTSNRVENLKGEDLESRVAPLVLIGEPGGSDGHRDKPWKHQLPPPPPPPQPVILPDDPPPPMEVPIL